MNATTLFDSHLACAFCGLRVVPEVHDGRPVIPIGWTLTVDGRAACTQRECQDHSRAHAKGATTP